jgi:hypothetical protein
LDELRRRTQDLGLAIQQIGASMYGQEEGPGTPPPGGMGGEAQPPPDEDIVDGEFSEA